MKRFLFTNTLWK